MSLVLMTGLIIETALAEIRTARKLLSETAIELNLGRHYTGREYEDD